MKYCILFLLFFSGYLAKAQKGYLITENDSIKSGYLSYQLVYGTTDKMEIVLYKTRKDKKPVYYPISSIKEFAIKKDTLAVLTDFYPFANRDLYIELVTIKLIERGALSLYWTNEVESGRLSSSIGPQGQINYGQTSTITYFIADKNKNFVALDRNNFQQELRQYLDFNDIVRKLKLKKVSYNHIPKFIKLYNQLN